MWSGRAFQVAGPACENVRSPRFDKARMSKRFRCTGSRLHQAQSTLINSLPVSSSWQRQVTWQVSQWECWNRARRELAPADHYTTPAECVQNSLSTNRPSFDRCSQSSRDVIDLLQVSSVRWMCCGQTFSFLTLLEEHIIVTIIIIIIIIVIILFTQ